MSTPSHPSLPELARSMRGWIFGAAIATAIGFHFLISHIPVGWTLALFALIVTGGIFLVALETERLRNPWALLFLIPLLSACISTTIYSSDTVKVLSFFTIVGSLMGLGYWLTAPPVNWRNGIPLWKTALFLESVLPFRQYQMLFTEPGGNRRVNSKLIIQVLVGLIIAVPILFIFLALFLEGDRYFQEVLGRWITFNFLTRDIIRLVFDVLVVLFASGFFWGIARRSQEEAVVKEPKTPFQEIVATRSFLFAIGALFIVFAGFQLFYLFQGSQYLLAQGKTYADYAVSGYQQLCFAAALAFLILLVVYRLTRMEDLWVRRASQVIAITSIISTLSAAKRLWLYVDAYGLTLSRSWGMQFLVLVILLFVLLIVSVVRRWNVHQLTSAGSALVLGLLSLALLVNQEALVASYNLKRHMEQRGPALDWTYLVYRLGSDAVPTIASAMTDPSWNELTTRLAPGAVGNKEINRDIYYRWRAKYTHTNETQDPRELSLSDLQAKRIVESLPEVK